MKNSESKPDKQKGKTCYANAIAAVYHLAMRQIIGRSRVDGLLKFESIRDSLTKKYGSHGFNTEFAIDKTCGDYHLRYKELT